MKNSLVIYDNEKFGKIRGLIIDGNPYFVGKDVAQALGYTNSRKAIRDHVDIEDAREERIVTPSGTQATKLINESGLYSLILSSKLPTAKEFKRWVTSEVLPSIRKTGSYELPKDEKWLEFRTQAKETYKDLDSVKKMFIEYARSQGYEGKDGYIYGTLAIKTNEFVGLPKRGGRDNGTIPQLSILSIVEHGMKNILIQGMASGLHYTQIIAQVDVWLSNFRKENYIDSYLNQKLIG